MCAWTAQVRLREDASISPVNDDDSQAGEPCDSTISDPREDSVIDGPATGGHVVAIVAIFEKPGPATFWPAHKLELFRVEARIPTIHLAPKTSPPDRV